MRWHSRLIVTAYNGPHANVSPKKGYYGSMRGGNAALQEAEAGRFGDCLSPAIDLEFLIDAVGVFLDCLGREGQRVRDLFVAHPLRQKRQNFALAIGQRFDQLRSSRG
jgi:hypothetical protein